MGINIRRDGFVVVLLVVMILMLGAALTGAYRVFGYGFVSFVSLLLVGGFVQDADRPSWWPPVLATVVLLVAFTGMFAMEAVTVQTRADTWLGFQPGTAFLIYGVWIPAFFTIGLTFALVFNRLQRGDAPSSERKRARR